MENFTRSATTLKDPEPIGDNAYSVTIFANEMARDGIAIDPDTIDFSNYEKNPVVLYAHDFMGRTDSGGLPIGRTLKLVRAADGQIRADFEFLEGDPFAARVRNAWDRGFLRGASIGWRTEPAGRRQSNQVRAYRVVHRRRTRRPRRPARRLPHRHQRPNRRAPSDQRRRGRKSRLRPHQQGLTRHRRPRRPTRRDPPTAHPAPRPLPRRLTTQQRNPKPKPHPSFPRRACPREDGGGNPEGGPQPNNAIQISSERSLNQWQPQSKR